MTTETNDAKIICQIDGAQVHSVQHYIRDNHPDWTVERYKEAYPGQPLLSPAMIAKLRAAKAAKDAEAAKAAAAPAALPANFQAMHELFGFGEVKAAMSGKGTPIMIEVAADLTDEDKAFVPDVDPAYVFSIDLVKKCLAARAINKPMYLWGFHGTGKTTALEQVNARTGRPFMRVQHTVNTEEAHIVGQWTVKDGSTEFSLGPLPMAMLNGYTYCADEYDFAQPSVTSVYQAVLEGKPLVIKEAPPELRVIRPHKNFRFVATGNTNGSGDESGLYQGTQVQNAANFSRFGITEEVVYMEPEVETVVIAGQAQIARPHAEKFVEFAAEVRKAFKAGSLSMPVSPRELISAAQLGVIFNKDWKLGLKLAYSNRLSRVDRETVDSFAQRVFGA